MKHTLFPVMAPAFPPLLTGAGHAFAGPAGKRCLEEVAEGAWEKTLAFFAAELTQGEPRDGPAS